MDAADLIVFPSHLRACGRQCFEAGGMAKPIIVTMPDKNTKIILDGKTGLILPEKRPDILGHEIATFAINQKKGKRMGQEGLKYSLKTFSADIHAEKVMKLYDQIIQ